MKYNAVTFKIEDNYNNPEIKQLLNICQKYGYNNAKKIINRSKNIIDSYINLLLNRDSIESIKMLLIVKEIIFMKLLNSYTKRTPPKEDTETLTKIIHDLKPAEIEQLTPEDRKEVAEIIEDLKAEPLIINDFTQYTGAAAEQIRESRNKLIKRIISERTEKTPETMTAAEKTAADIRRKLKERGIK